jgi:hypothetical protein
VSSEKPFVPQFGPNGAVMNAPGMTEKMRAEIKETQSSGYWWKTLVSLAGLIAFFTVAAVVLSMILAPVAQRMAAEGNFIQAMGVMFLGAPVGLFLGFIALSVVAGPLARWEVIRRPSAKRKYAETPLAVRLGLAIAEMTILLAALSIPITGLFGSLYYWANLVACLAMIVAVGARLLLLKRVRD